MRISDWSADVCSSDLIDDFPVFAVPAVDRGPLRRARVFFDDQLFKHNAFSRATDSPRQRDRKSVVEGKSVSVRVDLGGGRITKKTTKETNNSHASPTHLKHKRTSECHKIKQTT